MLTRPPMVGVGPAGDDPNGHIRPGADVELYAFLPKVRYIFLIAGH